MENFEFRRFNSSILGKEIAQALLVHLFRKVLDEHVGLAVKVLVFFLGEDDLFSINNSVVHTFEASLSFFIAIEIEIAIASRLLGLLAKHDLNSGNRVAMLFEVPVEIEVKSL